MLFQYLGTAAAEGVPALWCNCERCVRSREIGGRALRTRSQAIVDGALLIDFPADTLGHLYRNGLDLLNVRDCLITHTHGDHLYPEDFSMLRAGYAHVPPDYRITFRGSEAVRDALAGVLAQPIREGSAAFEVIRPFEPAAVGRYTVTAYPAIHDPNAGPLFYGISDGERAILYAHDTGVFRDDVWAYWRDTHPHFDFVSLDCTNACLPLTYVGHMGLPENAEVRCRMIAEGYADERTVFVSNHFSHNGTNVVYDDFVPIAAREGLLVSYDGMKIRI